MTLISHIKCDACDKEILDDAPPHQTRLEFERQIDNGDILVIERRDLCDGCALRIKQAILGPLQGCEWLLDGFEVVRK